MVSLILGVDSGKKQGWAMAEGGLIRSCGLVQVSDTKPLDMPRIKGARVFIEYPIHYPKGRNVKKGQVIDPNDLIKLGSRAGRAQERYLEQGNQVTLVFPYEWKGQTPKHIDHDRSRGKLTRPEALAVWDVIKNMSNELAENVWDSIGIVLWVLEKEGSR